MLKTERMDNTPITIHKYTDFDEIKADGLDADTDSKRE